MGKSRQVPAGKALGQRETDLHLTVGICAERRTEESQLREGVFLGSAHLTLGQIGICNIQSRYLFLQCLINRFKR